MKSIQTFAYAGICVRQCWRFTANVEGFDVRRARLIGLESELRGRALDATRLFVMSVKCFLEPAYERRRRRSNQNSRNKSEIL